MRYIALKKLLFVSLITTMVVVVIWLSVRFSGPALHWQSVLKQAQTGLLIWRLCLYAAIAGCGWGLRRRLLTRYPALLPHLTRLACWSLAILVLNEISNVLQWRAMP
ncbi:hypothetical protein BH012_20575 [Salmonella enterica]|nr:hypothetical protein [Salmonella enterica]EAX6603691.1 hypothetical protein [Salmonella enterica]